MSRRVPVVVTLVVLSVAWWIARDPGRGRYLAHLLRQARHLLARYAV